MTIPDNCYECKILKTCDALPRWADKKYFVQYKDKRHQNCPYNSFAQDTGQMLDKVSKYISDELGTVYCNTCFYNLKSDVCEDCHRKNMYWCISDLEAKKIAEHIIAMVRGDSE